MRRPKQRRKDEQNEENGSRIFNVPASLRGASFLLLTDTARPKGNVGAWEYRSQVWCDFKEDGTCAIGGTTGTYSVSDDMVLTMTPNGGDAQTFEWAGAKEKVTTSNWLIADGTLYLNGGVYPRYTEDDTQAQSGASSSEAETASASSSGSSSQ